MTDEVDVEVDAATARLGLATRPSRDRRARAPLSGSTCSRSLSSLTYVRGFPQDWITPTSRKDYD